MAKVIEIERELLGLPPAERERLALKAWESLIEDGEAATDPKIDPEGIELARNRDKELEHGKTNSISDKEFRLRTGGNK
jgi:hypothetical protein